MPYVSLFDEYEVAYSETSSYSSVVDQTKVAKLVERATGAKYSNGECVRLERCSFSGDKASLVLTKASFYDFITSNMALLNCDRIASTSTTNEMVAMTPLLRTHEASGKPNSVQDIIQRSYLSGVLAISCMLVDERGSCLLVKRSGKVGIGSNHLSVSVTGSVEPVDLKTKDPLFACCQRECLEELGVSLSQESVSPIGIVCGEKKLQPIALFEAVVPDFDTLPAKIASAIDYSFENSGYVICKRSELNKMLVEPSILITEAGRVHFKETAR